jgi:hypothetical protein
MDEVPNRPEGNVRIVTNPRIGEKDVREQDQQ